MLLRRAQEAAAAVPAASVPAFTPIQRPIHQESPGASGGGVDGPKGKGRSRLGIGCAVVLIGFLGLGLFGVILAAVNGGSDDQETLGASLASQAEPDSDTRETSIVNPTPTPRPTSTPRPTATIADAYGYSSDVIIIMEDFADSMVRFGSLSSEADFLNPDWLADIKAETNVMRGLRRDFQKLTPPPEFQTVHRLTDEAMGKTIEAGDLVYEGSRDFDVSKIERAVDLIDEANGLINEATSLLPSS